MSSERELLEQSKKVVFQDSRGKVEIVECELPPEIAAMDKNEDPILEKLMCAD